MERRNRSWLKLLAYCLTIAVAAGLALAILLASATLALASGQSNDASNEAADRASSARTISGVITDSYCGARHSQTSGKTSDECTRSCVRHGAKYRIVSGENSYVLAGNENDVDRMAGQRARVNGTVEGHILQVSSVTAIE